VNRRDRRIVALLKEKQAKHLDRCRHHAGGTTPVLGGGNVVYEVSQKTRGIASGGVSAIHAMVQAMGFDTAINANVSVLKEHKPYHESDHILALAYMVLNGGTCVEDLGLCREDVEWLRALGAQRLPDPTTAGDFLRRFEPDDIRALIETTLRTQCELWRTSLSEDERRVAHIDCDGTIVGTDAQCMEGIDYSYKKIWGYAPLLLSLAETNQPLAIVNRPGNASSNEGAAPWIDLTLGHVLSVFGEVVLRGDTDFSQTRYLDAWHETGRIRFVFGYDARSNLIQRAQALATTAWKRLKRPAPYEIKTRPRTKPRRIKDEIIEKKGWRTLRLLYEDIAEFDYQPVECRRSYRMVVVRKTIKVTEGQLELEPETRYFFYITNDPNMPANRVVREANHRCNQENLIAQLAGQVHALSTAANDLNSNWAWMVIASLAWVMKSWFALFIDDPAQRKRTIGMEFKAFLARLMRIPVQIISRARYTVLRIIGGHLQSLPTFLAAFDRIRQLQHIRA
jgi:hypothetical protein